MKRKHPKMPVLILEPQQEMAAKTSEQPKCEDEGRHLSGSLRLIDQLAGHLPKDPADGNVPALLQVFPACPNTTVYLYRRLPVRDLRKISR